MAKEKISIIVEIEYELNPNYYPDESTPEQMLSIDLEGTKDDPYATMDRKDAKWSITGELVK